MGIENIFGLAQVSLYIVLFILSFLICIPAGVNVSDFERHCLLSASGHWKIESSYNRYLIITGWGPNSACHFTIFLGVLTMVVSLFYSVWTGLLLAKGIYSTWLDAFLNLIVNIIMCVCFFSTALTVSIGFRDWCSLITSPLSDISSCEDGQDYDLGLDGSINSGDYYTHWEMAQFSLWLGWIFWLILSVMSLLRQYRFHRQEAFLTSIDRERQRLLQRVGHSYESA